MKARGSAKFFLWLLVCQGCGGNNEQSAMGAGAGTSGAVGASGAASSGGEPNGGAASGEGPNGGASSGGGESGGSVGLSCDITPVPCGGDPSGSWQIQKSCLLNLVGTASCSGLTLDGSGLMQTGSINYAADKTYSSTSALTGVLKAFYPTACITGLTCPSLAQALSSASMPGYGMFDCANDTSGGGGCLCTSVVSTQAVVETGSYSTSGNVLTQTRSGGGSIAVEYCVQGRTLTAASRSPSTGKVAQIVLLDKQ